jgi:hypothetical protein
MLVEFETIRFHKNYSLKDGIKFQHGIEVIASKFADGVQNVCQ